MRTPPPDRGRILVTSMDCRVFSKSLYHFQADELPRAERESFERHLTACPPCARRHEIEEGLLRGLRARLTPAQAPPGLETRIRAQFEQNRAGRRSATAWIRTPWFAAIAASILLAVLLVPGQGLIRTSAVERVDRVVTLVDRACDSAGRSFEQQRGCERPKHLNAFKLEDGTYWDLSLDRDAARDLVTAREMRGTRMHVEGWLYERIDTLQLESAQPIGPASTRLTFHGL